MPPHGLYRTRVLEKHNTTIAHAYTDIAVALASHAMSISMSLCVYTILPGLRHAVLALQTADTHPLEIRTREHRSEDARNQTESTPMLQYVHGTRSP